MEISRDNVVVIVGVTGAVGVELLRLLETRTWVGTVRGYASKDGAAFQWRGQTMIAKGLVSDEAFEGARLVLFSAGSKVSQEWAPKAVAKGCVVVDNSSYFRSTCPLVVPEINAMDIKAHKGIIANPNCTTAITLMALWPLHQLFHCERVFASSYQAVSGTGARAIDELKHQLAGDLTVSVYPAQIAHNVIPQVDTMLDTGYTKEEMKMENEGRRIMHHDTFQASVTCVRVPVFRAHSVAVTAQFSKPVNLEEAKRALSHMPGLDLIEHGLPTPLNVAGKENVQVGRLRVDCASANGLSFWVVGDQLLKGAALNAVQIADHLLRH